MDTPQSLTNVYATEEISVAENRAPSWGAIIAGAVAGLAVHFLLLMLGSALGLGAAEPGTAENPIATFSTGTAIVWSVSALIALFVGGWVAGRCAARQFTVSGAVHGFMVWCLATVIGLLLVASGAGALVGGSARIVGDGLKGAGAASSGIAELAKEAAQRNGDSITSFLDEASAAVGNQNTAQGIAARREVGQALRRMFAEGGDLKDAENRQALVRALTASGTIDEARANQMVDRWVASADELRNDLRETKEAAVAKAKEVADKTADALAKAALWTFIGFVLGAIAATLGGKTGSRWEYRHAAPANLEGAVHDAERRSRRNRMGHA